MKTILFEEFIYVFMVSALVPMGIYLMVLMWKDINKADDGMDND